MVHLVGFAIGIYYDAWTYESRTRNTCVYIYIYVCVCVCVCVFLARQDTTRITQQFGAFA
jgi:hypothetical protein